MKPEAQAQHDQETGELYKAIGRLIVKFEHVIEAVRLGIMMIAGLFNDHTSQRVARIMMVRMSASQLQGIYAALLAERLQLDHQDQAVLKNLFARFEELVKKRNDTVHNTWYIGWASPDAPGFTRAPALKWGRGKSGATLQLLNYDAAAFNQLADEAEELSRLFQRLNGVISTRLFGVISSGSAGIARNFEIAEDGTVRDPTQT